MFIINDNILGIYIFVLVVTTCIYQIYKHKEPGIKGRRGERKVARTVSRYVSHSHNNMPSSSRTLRNVYLPWPNGSTTEIDEIVISTSGILVFEVKNYNGWIFGSQNNSKWTQVLPKGYSGKSEKNSFFNPIKQNGYHIACIRKNLNDNSIPYHSIVVFSDSCTFKDISYDPHDLYVIHRCEIREAIETIDSFYKGTLSQEEVDAIYNKLLESSKKDKHINKQHVKGIRTRQTSATDLVCPWCGSRLVLRTAKKGPHIGSRFYGCSSFPDCRYVRNI